MLVHDAARPCVSAADIERLITAACAHPVGGILAAPVRDTMKRADEHGAIQQTERREGLWHALTPQMFRLAALQDALEQAVAGAQHVTDEAQAMELQGHHPLLVPGEARNIKVTLPEDLLIADLVLSIQEKETCA